MPPENMCSLKHTVMDMGTASAIPTLLACYVEACERHGVVQDIAICVAFTKMKLQPCGAELELILDHMTDADAPPVVDFLATAAMSSELAAVDVIHDDTNSSLDGLLLLQLLRAAGSKLRSVNLRINSFGRDTLRNLFQGGIPCATLDLSLSRVRRMDMTGQFAALHTLKLDYLFAVTSLPEGCFKGMPNLARLSMCRTRIANLWTTCAVLSKLTKLIELRFQKRCLCCQGTGQCVRISGIPDFTLQKETWQPQADTNQNMNWSPTTTGDEYDSLEIDQSEFSRTESDNLFSDDDSTLNTQQVNTSTGESTVESEAFVPSDANGRNLGSAQADEESYHHDEDMDFTRHSGSSVTSSAVSDPHILEDSLVGTSAQREDLELLARDRIDSDELLGTIPIGHTWIHQLDDIDTIDFIAMHRRVAGAGSDGPGSSGDEGQQPDKVPLGLSVHHSSPICFERHYREFIISSLKSLQVLDNISISDKEKFDATQVYSEHFEARANNRGEDENVLAILKRREMGGWNSGGGIKHHHRSAANTNTSSTAAYCRSLCAAKMASCTWPAATPICRLKTSNMDANRRCRPRQFEYHPTEPSQMVIGSQHGEVVVVNHESDKVVGYVQSVGAPHSILGLCWLNKDPSKLIAGSDNGSLQLYDVKRMHATIVIPGGRSDDNRPNSIGLGPNASTGRSHRRSTIYTYDDFEQLTSVHINSTDEYILASGYSKHVSLYDLRTGKRLQIFPDLHQEHINVVKFAHHSPHLFATSSFDKDIKMWDIRQKAVKPLYTVRSVRGNVMVCFSRDDHYLLSSAVDNEVRQHLSVDGKLHMKFDIPPTGSSQNYTRSYYMNGRDYIVTGSCEESLVRICCAQTGRRLRDLALEGRGLFSSSYVQSLRGDPFKDFHFSVLVSYNHRSEILKVNLLSTDGHGGIESEPQFASLVSLEA